jgi:hypothetical protein
MPWLVRVWSSGYRNTDSRQRRQTIQDRFLVAHDSRTLLTPLDLDANRRSHIVRGHGGGIREPERRPQGHKPVQQHGGRRRQARRGDEVLAVGVADWAGRFWVLQFGLASRVV